jgi:tetratricopeptide (TPR) repeat protein
MKPILVLLLSLLISAGEAPEPSITHARELLAQGSYAVAIQELRGIVKASPDNPDARLLLGSALAAEGQRGESIQQLTEAVRLKPDWALAYNALGFALSRFAEMEAAQGALERAVELEPGFAEAHINLALVLAQRGNLQRASEHLDRAIQIQGDHPAAAYAFYLKGKIDSQQNEFDKAVADLQNATRLRTDFAEAWLALGLARRVALDSPGALRAFEHAALLAPRDPAAQYHLGLEYLQNGQPQPAVVHLRQSLDSNPGDKAALYNLQRALRQDGQPEEAHRLEPRIQQLIEQASRSNENSFLAAKLDSEGVDLEKAGNLRLAINKYREALELYPNHDGFRLNYGLALCRAGQWEAGIAEIREVLHHNPDNAEATRALYLALDKQKSSVEARKPQ